MVQISFELWTHCNVITVASSFCSGHFLGSSLCYEAPMHMQKPVNCAYFGPADLTHAGLLQVRLRLELRNKLGRLGPWTLLCVCFHFHLQLPSLALSCHKE